MLKCPKCGEKYEPSEFGPKIKRSLCICGLWLEPKRDSTGEVTELVVEKTPLKCCQVHRWGERDDIQWFKDQLMYKQEEIEDLKAKLTLASVALAKYQESNPDTFVYGDCKEETIKPVQGGEDGK